MLHSGQGRWDGEEALRQEVLIRSFVLLQFS
jgi:hypothetical protein